MMESFATKALFLFVSHYVTSTNVQALHVSGGLLQANSHAAEDTPTISRIPSEIDPYYVDSVVRATAIEGNDAVDEASTAGIPNLVNISKHAIMARRPALMLHLEKNGWDFDVRLCEKNGIRNTTGGELQCKR
jgi:hypothetical protein